MGTPQELQYSFQTSPKGRGFIKIIGLRQNFVKKFLITLSRAHAVCWNVLKAVAGSDVHDAAPPQLPGRVGGNPDTGLAALYPEPAGLRIGGTESAGRTWDD